MNVITVSREYGAGGGEIAQRLAATLGWELLDRELLHQAAAVEHPPDTDLERLDEQALSLADRFRLTLHDAAYLELAQRRALPLASLDMELCDAARALGLELAAIPG